MFGPVQPLGPLVQRGLTFCAAHSLCTLPELAHPGDGSTLKIGDALRFPGAFALTCQCEEALEGSCLEGVSLKVGEGPGSTLAL